MLHPASPNINILCSYSPYQNQETDTDEIQFIRISSCTWLCVTTTTVRLLNWTVTGFPAATFIATHPHPWRPATSNMSPISMVVVFHRCYISGIMQSISSAIGFFPISTVSLGFSQVVPCISGWLLFVAEWCSLIGMRYSLTPYSLKYICITPFSGEKTHLLGSRN